MYPDVLLGMFPVAHPLPPPNTPESTGGVTFEGLSDAAHGVGSGLALLRHSDRKPKQRNRLVDKREVCFAPRASD